VKDAFVVFHYGIFPQSVETLAKLGVRLHGLATWRDTLAAAEAAELLSTADAKDVRAFLDDPKAGRPPMAGSLSVAIGSGVRPSGGFRLFGLPARTCSRPRTVFRTWGFSASISIFLRMRVMRTSMLRSKTSDSRLWARSSS